MTAHPSHPLTTLGASIRGTQASNIQANGASLLALLSKQTARFSPVTRGVMLCEVCPMNRSGVVRMLQALPRFTPDPRWKAAAKRRLLLAYDRWYAGMRALRHWAVYVSGRPDSSH